MRGADWRRESEGRASEEEKTEEEGKDEKVEMDHGQLGNGSTCGHGADGAIGAQRDGAAGDAVLGVQGDRGIEDLSQSIQTEGIAPETETETEIETETETETKTAGVQTGGFSLGLAPAGALPQGEAQQEKQEAEAPSESTPQVCSSCDTSQTISKYSFAQMYSRKEPAGPLLVAPVDTTAIDR